MKTSSELHQACFCQNISISIQFGNEEPYKSDICLATAARHGLSKLPELSMSLVEFIEPTFKVSYASL
jgi:hypothetical protein